MATRQRSWRRKAVVMPDAPGLGIKLNEKAFAGKGMQPWRLRLVMAPDGNVMYQ